MVQLEAGCRNLGLENDCSFEEIASLQHAVEMARDAQLDHPSPERAKALAAAEKELEEMQSSATFLALLEQSEGKARPLTLPC